MNDEYISKQKVLDYLNGYLHSLGEGGADDLLFDRGQRRALINAIQDILAVKAADVQPVNKWISCKDKMPEDNTSVLFVYVSEHGVKSVHYGYHQTLKGLGSSWAKPSGGWQYCDDDITHWQPLPEPPKDGDEECQ